jgi:predicted Zn-dependent protease
LRAQPEKAIMSNLYQRLSRRIILPLVLLAIVSLHAGCAVSDQQVIANANQFQTQLKPAVMTDPQLSAYLQKIGDRIIAAAKEFDAEHQGPPSHFKGDNSWMFSNQMQFHFVNSKTVNAFTTGGEHMYVYNALFQMCKSEEELAAVMSHEYAHVYCRHVAKGQSRQLATLATAALVGGAAGYALGGKEHGAEYAQAGAGLGAAGGQFVNMGFTRGDEEQADQWGFKFYTRAGWDPNHFADFFKAMIAAGYDKTPGYMSDHPTLASRVQKVNEWVKDLGPNAGRESGPIASAAQFRDYQQRAAEIAKRTPDDSTIQNGQQLAAALPHSCVMPTDPPEAVAARSEIQHRAEQASKKKHTSSE